MAFRRRSSTAPYEVMGAGPRAHGPSPTPGSAPVQPVISKAPGTSPGGGENSGTTGDATWAARRHAPVVMRVPRGWLAAGALLAVAVLALAYWVGQSRGFTKGVKFQKEVEANQTAQEASQAAQYAPASANGASTSGIVTPKPAPAPPPSEQPQVFRGPQGQRQPGYCYFILITSNQDGANALVKFLRDNGVDAGAFPVQHGRFYQVIALRGFRPDQLLSPQRREYESQLRSLGRLWKRKATPRGTSDLSDMYIMPEPYKEPAAP